MEPIGLAPGEEASMRGSHLVLTVLLLALVVILLKPAPLPESDPGLALDLLAESQVTDTAGLAELRREMVRCASRRPR